MRFKLILPSNNQKVSDYEVKCTKLSHIVLILETDTRYGSEAEFRQNNFMQRLPNIWDKLPRELLKQKIPVCSLRARRVVTYI